MNIKSLINAVRKIAFEIIFSVSLVSFYNELILSKPKNEKQRMVALLILGAK